MCLIEREKRWGGKRKTQNWNTHGNRAIFVVLLPPRMPFGQSSFPGDLHLNPPSYQEEDLFVMTQEKISYPATDLQADSSSPGLVVISEEIDTEPYWRWLSMNYAYWSDCREMRWFKDKRHWIDIFFTLAILIISVGVRMWDLKSPGAVVFDEVHFGKFAGRHLNRTFFVDVHPPLAKLMITAAGYVSGYDGKFAFDQIGMDYESAHVPFEFMRGMGAFLGSLTVSLAFMTLREAGLDLTMSFLGSMAVLFGICAEEDGAN